MAVTLEVNRKRIQRLMRILGIEALYPKPNLSRPAPGHQIYPYLLRGVAIERPNHVWSTDITYIPMRGGFLYLVAVMDWFSRFVLSWELSNTMETGFCLAALDAAFRFGQPEIWNSDQGSQFTSADFLAPLKKRGISISMDRLSRRVLSRRTPSHIHSKIRRIVLNTMDCCAEAGKSLHGLNPGPSDRSFPRSACPSR